jgi:hypothetical protein
MAFIVLDLGPQIGNSNINVACDDDGYNLLFESDSEAEMWADENCAWDYQIIEI